jgi:asparagine synthase (glutamine-hydrolysing)
MAAIHDPNGAPGETEGVEALLAAIAHRGLVSTTWSGPGIALGQRTLPTTPESRHETLPLNVAGGRYQIALDGRLDNRRDLMTALTTDDRGRVQTDADLIALAYEKWGSRCVERLVGDFAFVLWDQPARRVYAARDQRGFRPLVYVTHGQGIVFGSEPQQLLSQPGVSRSMDSLYLACHLTGATPPLGSTPYASVREVPAAHYCLVEDGELSLHEYWRFAPRPLLKYKRREEYVEHFESVFAEAVAAATRTSKPPAVMLSGGLDSSYVASRAIESAPLVHAVHAFAPGTRHMDERLYARAVADRLGLALHEVNVSDCWSLSSTHLSDADFDQPNVPMQAALLVRLAQATRDAGCSVLLDGVGGDEFLAGSPDYLAELVRGGHWLEASAELRAWSSRVGVSARRLFIKRVARPLAPASLRKASKTLLRRSAAPPPPWIDATKDEGLEVGRLMRDPFAARYGDFGLFWSYMRSAGLPIIAWRERRASLPSGIETRSPFWDLRVMDYLIRVPSWLSREAGRPKALLRAAMQGHLPDEVVERDDKGLFNELMDAGLFERETARVERAVCSETLVELGYVSVPALQRELDVYRETRHAWWHSLWRAITAGLWLDGEKAIADRQEGQRTIAKEGALASSIRCPAVNSFVS